MKKNKQLSISVSRREFLKLGAAGAASAALGTLGLPESVFAAGKEGKPNIIVILADDQGYAELGCQGIKDIPTPHIDSIAANGVRFTQGYVSCPVCSPTRAGLMTGRYQTRFGHEVNPGPPTKAEPQFGLPLTEVTLPQRLKTAGYVTGMVGKWHLGYKPELLPTRRGFDEFFGFPGGAHNYFAKAEEANPIMRGTEPVEENEYLTDAFAREATAFVRKHAKEPFFLYLAFNAVHSPLQAPDKYMKRFEGIRDKKRHTFAAMLSAMDDAVGQVLDEVRKNKLEENTLIIYLSDNGGPTSQTTSRNDPLRGVKGQVLEGGFRIPYLMQWKGKLPAGTVYDKPVISLDIHATAIALAGIDPPTEKKLDGVNLIPFITGKNSARPHETLYWRYGRQWAIRKGDMKLLSLGKGEPELYDLAADIHEDKNLATEKPERAKELKALWDKWNEGNIDPLWGRARGTVKRD